MTGPAALVPLRGAAADVARLRGGPDAAALTRVAVAVESSLRRLLRDDPTAPVELRLRALATEDLTLDDLLSELRSRERIPLQVAAGVHALAGVAARVRAGAEPTADDAGSAASVADALATHLLSTPDAVLLEDPLLNGEPAVPLGGEIGSSPVHRVPREERGTPWRWLALVAGVLAVVALVLLVLRQRGPGDQLARADALVEQGDVAQAAGELRALAASRPADPRPAVRLARLLREAGRPVEALRVLRDALGLAPGDARLNEELGLLLLEVRRPADAVRPFRAALLADSTSERAWVGMVRALRESGQAPVAEQFLLRAPEAARALAGPPPLPPVLPAAPAPAAAPAPFP